MKTVFMAAALAAILVMVLTSFGIWETLGAHHFWDVKAGLIGAVLGLATAVLLAVFGMGARVRLVVSGAVLVASALIAWQGKAVFVASYAENDLAGKSWYFGWFGITAGLVMVLSMVAERALRSRSQT